MLALGSDSLAGRGASALDPRLNGSLPPFVSNDEAAASGADVLFLCLDNEAAAAFEPPADTLVVDLSGAHRLVDDELARGWYGTAPGAWSYGLPELFPADGLLIANPGCYATAALLALAPLAQVADGPVVVDGKSGVSGAGRTLKQSSHAGSVLENVSPYAVGEHRHAPEIAQQLGFPSASCPTCSPCAAACSRPVICRRTLTFARCSKTHMPAVAVVRGAPGGRRPGVARVQGTDAAEIGVYADAATRDGDRHLRDRQPRQGRRRTGGAEREPRARLRRDRGPAA